MIAKLLAAAAAAVAIAACSGPKTLTLPAEPVDRAATCAIVAAAEARSAAGADVAKPLPLEAQGRILHHAMLAASESGRFSADAARAVNDRMQALQDEVTSGAWQDLAPACRAAFPLAWKDDPSLPEARFEAQIACEELAQFLFTALEPQKAAYGSEIADYRRLRRELNDAMGAGLRRKAGARLDAQAVARDEGLAAAAQLGSPVPVMRACLARFG